MEFIKNFNIRRGREPGCGSIYITNGCLKVRINVPNAHVTDMGLIDGGIGCVITTGDKNRKTPYVAASMKYQKDWLPPELQGAGYKFTIPAQKLSDTEYAFLFCNAKMTNKK